MKRLIILASISIVASLLSILILPVSHLIAAENNVKSADQFDSRIEPSIVISTSHYDIDGDGNNEIIEILQTKGKFIDGNSELPWCGGRDRWKGDFTIRVRNGSQVLSEQSLSGLFGEQFMKDNVYLSFWAPKFQIVFKDYNNDGQIDFNLGQYGICAGNDYYLFTIDKKGRIKRLLIEEKHGDGGLYVQGESHDNSTNKITSEKGVIKNSIFNRDTDMLITTFCKWTGDKFVVDKVIRELVNH